MNKIYNILKGDNPAPKLKELFDNGKLKKLLPELYNLSITEKGHKNNFRHTLGVLNNVIDNGDTFNMRLVAIFHDIGKPYSKKLVDGEWTFHMHEKIGANLTKKILIKWGLDDETINYVYRMIHYHGSLRIPRIVTDSALRRIKNEIGEDIIFDLINFCKYDITTSKHQLKNRIIESLTIINDRLRQLIIDDEYNSWKNPLTGDIIMEILNIPPSKVLGDIKKELEPKLRSNEITLDEAIEYIIMNKSKWV